MVIRVTRRWWLWAGLGAPLWTCLGTPDLAARLDGDELRVAAPSLHILTGKPLERLHNGATVGFAFQLTLTTAPGSTPWARSIERFVVSYDLWEEKFSVARLGKVRRSASHLSAGAAESWCLDNLALTTAGYPPNRPFWLRLEVRADDPQGGLGVVDEPGINLTRLVEIFSRPPRAQQPRWQLEAGPLLLAEVRKSESLRR
jgi:hypothetical protein